MSTSETSWYVPETAAAGGRPPRRLLLGMMVAVFVSGSVIGSGSTLMLINRRIEENEKHHDPVSVSAKIVPELQEKLSLSEQQTAEVDQIMKEHLAALDRLRREVFFVKIREEFKQMQDQVDAVLNDQQRSQWHAWLDERRKRVCPPPGDHRWHGNRHRKGPSDGSATSSRDNKSEGAQPAQQGADASTDAGASTKADAE